MPSIAEEGIRDLCRARQVVVEDRRRARQRLGSFLLRHNEIYREQTAWTQKHEEWIAHRHFADQATKTTFAFSRAAVAERDAVVDHRRPIHDRLAHPTSTRARPPPKRPGATT